MIETRVDNGRASAYINRANKANRVYVIGVEQTGIRNQGDKLLWKLQATRTRNLTSIKFENVITQLPGNIRLYSMLSVNKLWIHEIVFYNL